MGVNCKLFADNGNGIIGGKDIEYMAQILNRVCRDLSQWGKKCGLMFNGSQTLVILFTISNLEKKKHKGKKNCENELVCFLALSTDISFQLLKTTASWKVKYIS